MCSITGVACEYRAHLEILSSLLSLSLSDIHPQRVHCDLHDAFTDETMATRLRVLNRWALSLTTCVCRCGTSSSQWLVVGRGSSTALNAATCTERDGGVCSRATAYGFTARDGGPFVRSR